MSEISLKSITGITSITTPAGVDNQLTLHNNNTTEAVKVDAAGNVHVNNQLSIAGVSTFSEDVKFVGATSGRDVQWDKSANYLRFKDNAFATFGNSDDLFIYHDGNHSQIRDVGTGHLILGGTHLYLTDGSGSEYFLQCIANNQVDLYFNNSIKLSTTSTGTLTTGFADHRQDSTSAYSPTGVPSNVIARFYNESNTNSGHASINLGSRNSGGSPDKWYMTCVSNSANFDGDLTFTTRTSSTNYQEVVRFTNDGHIQIPNDSGKLQLGASQDLELFHTGTHSYIQNSVGNLLIGSNYDGDVGGDIYIQAKYGENSITCFDDGGVELFYDAVKKFETISTGISVTGSTNSTVSSHNTAMLTLTANMGSYNNRTLIISSPVTDSTHNPFRFQTNNAFEFQVDGARTLFIHESGRIDLYHDGSTDAKLSTSSTGINISGDLTLTDTTADSAAGPELKLYRNSASPADADYLGQIKFAGESDTGVERNYAKITGKILDASNGTEDGILEFAHIKAGSQNISARFRSDSLQLLNGTSLTVAGTSTFTGDVDISDSIVHTGDTDTKIRFPNPDQISFETGGSERGRFDDDGNFLIGTTSHGNAGSGARHLVISGPSNQGLTINSTSTSGIYRDCNIYFGFGTSTTDMAKGQLTYSGNGDYFHMSVGNSSYTLAKSFRLSSDGTVRFDSTHNDAHSQSLVIKSHKARALNDNNGIVFRDANDHTQAVINVTKMSTSDASSDLVFRTSSGQVVNTLQGIPERMRIKSDGHVLPAITNTQDLGSSSKRWRNVYTTDLQLSNEGKTNDVDNTWGDYTIQEGESDLFLINNRNGKKYKFNLTEVS